MLKAFKRLNVRITEIREPFADMYGFCKYFYKHGNGAYDLYNLLIGVKYTPIYLKKKFPFSSKFNSDFVVAYVKLVFFGSAFKVKYFLHLEFSTSFTFR